MYKGIMKGFIVCMICHMCMWGVSAQSVLDLSGGWKVKLDNDPEEHAIALPGTTDQAELGIANRLEPAMQRPQLSHLTRKNGYVGPAYYSKEVVIPGNWKKKRIRLFMERVLWKSGVWVDGKEIPQSCNSLVAPHIYDLTGYLSPGKHLITIQVDNRKQFEDISLDDMAHAYTDHTQIKWNGVLGKILLRAEDLILLSRVEITPDISTKSLSLRTVLYNYTNRRRKVKLNYSVYGMLGMDQEVYVKPGENQIQAFYQMDKKAELWSEFTPKIYVLNVKVKSGNYRSELSSDFGLHQIGKQGNQITGNGVPLFLRGTLECCVFPLTGCPPMDKEGWKKEFRIAREWGLNHFRFHSWCPPEAAFEAADEMGFYLQVELPVWSLKIGNAPELTQFMKEEAERIVCQYGNHPSFSLFSMGNELQGNMEILSEMVDSLKRRDQRRLYSITSFTFEKNYGDRPAQSDDFFITQWTPKGWVRGQGVFNSESPSFDKDYSASLAGLNVPVVSHEIGQYAVYPDLKEIEKYTGVLDPINFKTVREDLERKNLFHNAEDFLQASGKLAALLYKEEIERALKTPGVSGYQLLGLQDFPGQGTALVGLLNAFWESKGVTTSQEFSRFCAPVVPLLRFPKAVYTNEESFKADVEVTNYSGKEWENTSLSWMMKGEDGNVLGKGEIPIHGLVAGHNGELGTIDVPLQGCHKATKLTVFLALDGTDYRNSWDIWAYPDSLDMHYGKVRMTRDYIQAKEWLKKGETVLFNPDWHSVKGVEGKFVPVFWSPVHFPKQAGTMGLLCNPKHPVFQNFPTDFHSDWQWWDPILNSTTLITDSIDGGTPLVSMIDNFTNNRRLASVYEGGVGKGKLLISSIDLCTNLEQRPVARQLLYSILNYMNGTQFNPSPIGNFGVMDDVFLQDTHQKKADPKAVY